MLFPTSWCSCFNNNSLPPESRLSIKDIESETSESESGKVKSRVIEGGGGWLSKVHETVLIFKLAVLSKSLVLNSISTIISCVFVISEKPRVYLQAGVLRKEMFGFKKLEIVCSFLILH